MKREDSTDYHACNIFPCWMLFPSEQVFTSWLFSIQIDHGTSIGKKAVISQMHMQMHPPAYSVVPDCKTVVTHLDWSLDGTRLLALSDTGLVRVLRMRVSLTLPPTIFCGYMILLMNVV